MSKQENKGREAELNSEPKADYQKPSKQWQVIFKEVGQDFYTGWLPNYIVTIVFVLCAPAIGLLMNTPKAIIIGVASGITIAVWATAFVMIRHISPPMRESREIEKSGYNISAIPPNTPLPEQKQEEPIEQRSDEEGPISEHPRHPQKQSKPLQSSSEKVKEKAPDKALTFRVRIPIPSDMSDAEILVDGKLVEEAERLPSFISLRVNQKSQPTKILLRKEEKSCQRTILIDRDINDLSLHCK
jgi:hypothetical protein